MLSAIASPRRLEILRLVWSEEMAAGAIHRAMPDVTFGAVSLQLRTLVDAGLLESRSEGRHRLYRARRDVLGPVGKMLEGMWSDALWRLKLQAELLETRRGPRPTSPGVRKADSPSNQRPERRGGAASAWRDRTRLRRAWPKPWRRPGAPRQTKKR